ncbi:MAG: hypothetical protein LBV59_11625 [Sphingobacterium sp.]|jgi:hypothetical protein|uniref:hypothetical protein n=1 Tax=Sphingobacterium sp. TaxID=341027 RepID=UPI002847B687|nr:hypothetical protein [Sphingobacterium sp.]MDR3008577.1 hypothetical protein [Sphingobacterium sp.]
MDKLDEKLVILAYQKTEFIYANFYQINKSCITKLNNNLDFVREEVCKSICFGLYQGAIGLTNHLIESFLRLNLAILESQATEYNEDSLIEINKKFLNRSSDEFGKLINSAKSIGLITKDQAKKIDKYRVDWRNPFSHGSSHQLLKNFGTVKMFSTSISGISEVKDVEIQGQYHLHGLMQAVKAAKEAIPYFNFVDNLIIDFYENLKK